MTAPLFESDYEEAFLKLLEQAGWTCTHGAGLDRPLSEPLIAEDLKAFLSRKYASQGLSGTECEKILFNLKGSSGGTDYLALRNTVRLYQEGFAFEREDPGLPPLHIDYIDYEEPSANIFRAVNQFSVLERGIERRPDILLFVNGIPVCIIELKNPASPQATVYNAWEQIGVRYRRDIPGLMKYCALSCISDGGATRLGTPCSPFEHYYAWKKIENEHEAASGLGEMQTAVGGAFRPSRLIKILRDFVYFPDPQEGVQGGMEIVCRYPQFFAARKLFDSVMEHLRVRGGDGKGGTYFGATGCGKTFTMLFLARQLIKRTALSPTVLIIVDREDLETQSGKLFESSTDFLGDDAVRAFESRGDLKAELSLRQTGGVYITTIQKFCETTGLLSERGNIICFSDEAHRSQLNLGKKLEIRDGSDGKQAGAFVRLGFAQHLHNALPNATFIGFTGTPIEETVQVFGPIVDRYTMRQAVEDGITVPLKYEARLARVILDTEKAKEIEDYYAQCGAEGASEEQIEASRRAMAKMEVILGDDERLIRMASDIARHYERYVEEHPGLPAKAMIVSSTREIAFRLYGKLKAARPGWFEPKRVADESRFSTPKKQALLQSFEKLPMVNLVATRGSNDPKAMFDALGDKPHRQMLDREFKKPDSNFRIALVVDMWITGFDVPNLCILYNDKPLQRHTLIQTISRVNRKFPGKEYGLIVDYIGIRNNMKSALKQFGGDEAPVADIEATRAAFVNELDILQGLMQGFDASPFFGDAPFERLVCLQNAAEFLLRQPKAGGAEFTAIFRAHVKRLKSAFGILHTAGALSEEETFWAQFFMAVQGLLAKTTSSVHTTETMNRAVEAMVSEALQCTGVETVLNAEGEEELFSGKFLDELEKVKLPFTKFQLLVKMLRRAIGAYRKTNRLKARRFDEMLQRIVDAYNARDQLAFTNRVAADTVNAISEEVSKQIGELSLLFKALCEDRDEFKRLGITFEEKAFYDILVDQRNAHGFEYPDEKCLALSRDIKKLVDDAALFANWQDNDNLKAKLQFELTVLLYKAGYPPQWNNEIFQHVMEQVNNFKTYQE